LPTDHLPAAKAGDAAAMNEFLTACVPVATIRVWRILRRDSHMVDDAVQESLIKVWRNLHTFHGGNLTGWVIRIATNVCYDMLRYQQRHPSDCIDDFDETLMDDYDPLDSLLRAEQAIAVRQAVGMLKDYHKVPVELVCLQEMEYIDAANLLGIPVGTLKSKVFRGKAALGKMLSEN